MSSSALPFFLHLLLLLLPPCCACCSRHLLLHAGANSSSLADMLQVTHGGANVTDGLRRYLARFGYESSAPDDADGRLVVSLYQSTLGLPVTGRLDNRTLDLLATPRCGVPDLQHNTATTARFAFFDGQPRWARAPGHFLLTYAVLSSPPYQPLPLPRSAVRRAFRRAFARWARVIPVRFRETRDYNTADVRVGFLAGDHGDGEPFDGPLGVLGHAFSPPSGQLHLDAAERWAVLGSDNNDADAGAVDLESVATHEIGHVLGLAHSSVPDAVMYPSLKPRTRKGGADPGRRPRRAGALRLQPALQPQLPLRARHLLRLRPRPSGGRHQVAREDVDGHRPALTARRRRSSAPPLLA